jgi:hypothetical protein
MDYLNEALKYFIDVFWKKLEKENSKISLKDQKIIYSKYFGNIFSNNEK